VKSNVFRHSDNQNFEGFDCIRILACYYYPEGSEDISRKLKELETSLLAISGAAEKLGFRARWANLTYREITHELYVPSVVQWGSNRFAVLFPRRKWQVGGKAKCVYPSGEFYLNGEEDFRRRFAPALNEQGEEKVSVLLTEPTFKFYREYGLQNVRLSWGKMIQYLRRNYSLLFGVMLGFLITSFTQLIFPFLMQSIVDVGIKTRDLSFVTIILWAQLIIVVSRTLVEFIRSRLLLQVSTIVNLSILSDFWIKITRLPISYFDRYHTGDILQRINDNKKVQGFLTGPVINTFFSAFNFIVFAIVLMMYKVQLFLVFSVGIFLYFGWMQLFFKIRRKINYELFRAFTRENNATLQLILGMEEILNNPKDGNGKRFSWKFLD
jgi:ATP-binding cassette subfamily B protein